MCLVRGPTDRLLKLCGVGADDSRLAIAGTLLDGMWPALVTHRRSNRPAKAAVVARLAAMARLSPHLASLFDTTRFAQEAPTDPV